MFGRKLTMSPALWEENSSAEFTPADARNYLHARCDPPSIPFRPLKKHPTNDLHLERYTHVLLKRGKGDNSLKFRFTGPYRLLRLNKKTAIIEKNGRPYKVSNTMLKGFKHRHLEFSTLIKEINKLKSLVPIKELEEYESAPSQNNNINNANCTETPLCNQVTNVSKERDNISPSLRRSERVSKRPQFYGVWNFATL